MIKVTINTSKLSVYHSLECKGHASYANAGNDIICAAVSVLFLNTINSIETFTKDTYNVNNYSEEDGWLKITFKEKVSHDTKLLIDALVLGLKTIQKEYGSKYINIVSKEV